jgi:predicted ATP-grasp superfamily ATP-dependent carboligase
LHAIGAGTLAPSAYLKGWRKPLVFAAFAKDDPLPGIVDLPIVAWRLLSRWYSDISNRIVRRARA